MGRRSFPPDSSIWLRLFEDYENAKIEYILNNCAKEYYFGFTNNMAIRAEVFKKTGFFDDTGIMGDTEMVHRCVSNIPGARVIYLDRMAMTHMEVTGLLVWLKKIAYYGEHNIQVEKNTRYKKIGFRVKMEIYRYCAVINKYTFFRNILFLFMLGIGELFYRVGILKGSMRSIFKIKE